MTKQFLTGPDISAYQGPPYQKIDVDFAKVAAAGHSFVIVKATEGTGYVNALFAKHWKAIPQHGMMRGAYHFGRWEYDKARAEAEHFVKTIGSLGIDDMSPILDLEWLRAKNPNAPGITEAEKKRRLAHAALIKSRTPDQIVDWTVAFLERVEELTERWPMLYTGPSFYKYKCKPARNGSRLRDWRYWCVDYDVPPGKCDFAPWDRWTLHQYTGHGICPGVQGDCDLNVFNGTIDDLNRLAGGFRL